MKFIRLKFLSRLNRPLFRPAAVPNNTTVTFYYENTVSIWWERLPAANIAVASYCYRLSRLEAAPTKLENLYETTPKWHSFLMIQPAASAASGWADIFIR